MWLLFGAAALAMFVVAFSNVAKGRIGSAVVFGLMGLIMSGIAGTLAVTVD